MSCAMPCVLLAVALHLQAVGIVIESGPGGLLHLGRSAAESHGQRSLCPRTRPVRVKAWQSNHGLHVRPQVDFAIMKMSDVEGEMRGGGGYVAFCEMRERRLKFLNVA